MTTFRVSYSRAAEEDKEAEEAAKEEDEVSDAEWVEEVAGKEAEEEQADGE